MSTARKQDMDSVLYTCSRACALRSKPEKPESASPSAERRDSSTKPAVLPEVIENDQGGAFDSLVARWR